MKPNEKLADPKILRDEAKKESKKKNEEIVFFKLTDF